MRTEFGLACAGWQSPDCPEYEAASAAASELFRDLGCAADLQFADMVWYRPHLRNDPDWCRSALEWVAEVRAWAAIVQPWGWLGPCDGPGRCNGCAGGHRVREPRESGDCRTCGRARSVPRPNLGIGVA